MFSLLAAFTLTPLLAKTAPVQTLDDFSFANPPQTLRIKILANTQINSEIMLYENYVVVGKIVNPSQNSFTFIPLKLSGVQNLL